MVVCKYMHTVRMAASRGYSLGWVNYDEQDRLRKATSPSSSWGGCRHGVVDVVRVNPSLGQYRFWQCRKTIPQFSPDCTYCQI